MKNLTCTHPRVLFVERNLDACALYKSVFEAVGCEVVIAGTGASALTLAHASDFDLIYTPIRMPDMNGFELATQLRKIEGCKDAILIALTGYSFDQAGPRYRAAGFDHYLPKPANLQDILAPLRTLFYLRDPAALLSFETKLRESNFTY